MSKFFFLSFLSSICIVLGVSVLTKAAPRDALITFLPGFNGSFPSKHYSGWVSFCVSICYVQVFEDMLSVLFKLFVVGDNVGTWRWGIRLHRIYSTTLLNRRENHPRILWFYGSMVAPDALAWMDLSMNMVHLHVFVFLMHECSFKEGFKVQSLRFKISYFNFMWMKILIRIWINYLLFKES